MQDTAAEFVITLIHSKEGVPIGDNRYVRVPSFVEQIADITIEEMVSALVNHGEAGVDALVKLLSWAGRTTNLHQLVGRLSAVHPNVLQSLSASVKLAELCQLRDHWLQNQQNAKEEFWQQLLAEHSFLLEQCFAFPISVINGKAYAGGKNLLNKGAQLPDFIVKNSMTQNLGLVEIKTPVADVLGKPYRGGILPLGAEVNGAVAQVLTYRASLQQEVVQMSYNEAERREAWAPPAVVICGTAKHLKPNERRSFELLRRQYHDVEILCFDELYARLESLISLLEEAEQPDAEAPEEDPDDLGF